MTYAFSWAVPSRLAISYILIVVWASMIDEETVPTGKGHYIITLATGFRSLQNEWKKGKIVLADMFLLGYELHKLSSQCESKGNS